MSSQPRRLYVPDANVFIAAHRGYYTLNLCPGFWDCLIHHFHSGRILSIDRVREELIGYGDELSDWVQGAPAEMFVASSEKPVIDAYQEVMSWVHGNAQFYTQAKHEFSQGADGWLVAYAMSHNVILVTLETYQQNVKRRVPIPNVCDQFGVARMDTFEMLCELGVRFDWDPSG